MSTVTARLPSGGRFLVAPLCLLVTVVLFSATTPQFATLGNAAGIASQMWLLALLAVGQCFAIASRGFDISIGAVAALSSTLAAMAVNAVGPIGLLAGPLAGLACGSLNGVLIGRAGLQPIVATLGVLIGARGLSLLITSDGQVVPLTDAGRYTRFAYETVLGLPPLAWAALAAVIFAGWVMRRTVVGRRIVMLGSNPEAVHLVGIDPARTHLAAYAICGGFAGLAGVLMTIRAGVGLPTEGVGMELQAIAAAVIGGTALSGGVVSVGAVVIGAAFMQALLTGLNLRGVSPFVAQTVVGAVIIGSGLVEAGIRRVVSANIIQRTAP